MDGFLVLDSRVILRDERHYLDSGAMFFQNARSRHTAFVSPATFDLLKYWTAAHTVNDARAYFTQQAAAQTETYSRHEFDEFIDELVRWGTLTQCEPDVCNRRPLCNLGITPPATGRYRPMTFPTKVNITSTMRCNLMCKHCLRESSPFLGTDDDMTTDQLTDLLTQLDVGGVIEIALSGGETTTRPDIVDVIRHSASLRCYFEFFTNGHVLRPRVVDALREVAAVKARGLQIHLSLDGATAEEHDWIRGPGSFRCVVNSMEILGSLQAPLVVESVLTPASASLAGIRRIVDTCKRRGVWGVSFHAASLSGRAGCRPSDFLFTLDGLARFRRDVELVAAENSDIKVEYEQYFYPGPRKPDAEVSLPPNVGPQGMYLMGIGANGDVYPCTEAIGDLTQIIGNVKRQSVLDVWQSERWTIHRGGWDLVDLKACRGCMFDGNCQMQTCRCYARRVRGDFYDAMPECYANRETLWNR